MGVIDRNAFKTLLHCDGEFFQFFSSENVKVITLHEQGSPLCNAIVCHIAWQLSSLTFCVWQLFILLFDTNRITIYTSISSPMSGNVREIYVVS